MTSRLLPYSRQQTDETDIAAVVGALRGDWLEGGPAVDVFEPTPARTADAARAVVCAGDLFPGDAVIVPAIAIAAKANVVRFVGAEVVR
jgi:dTDP-4-amino-4,6-dideoxygalactose transaminase